jgi:KaiC/GvpD/RAD55 family RecA-like ATPase
VGGPGSGKSIMAMQFLISGLEQGKSAVYVTFEENRDKVYKHMLQFGWNLEKYEKEKLFSFLEYSPKRVQKMLTEGGGFLETLTKGKKHLRIVIDSLTALALLYKDDLERREAILSLFQFLTKWNCTTVLTVEKSVEVDRVRDSTALEFEADNVIVPYNLRSANFRQRALEILKMRGTKHTTKIFPMQITEKGLAIFPDQTIF